MTLSGTIIGTGPLTKIGAGLLTLSGADISTGATFVEAGTLNVSGTLVSSVVTVDAGGTLAGSGTIAGLVAQSGGIVAPGAVTPFTTLNVSGNASFASGSTFLVNINASGQTDKLLVTGTATLNGGTVQVNGGTGITASSHFTILTAQGGVTGAFASVATLSSFAFLTPVLSEDANDVFLGFKPVDLTSIGLTRNGVATATALRALASGPLFDVVEGQSATGARQAFTSLSGEIHASVVTAAFEDALLPNAAILDRLNQPVAPPALGAAAATAGAFAADLPSGKGPALAPVTVRLYQPRLFDFWGQGFGDWGRTKSDGNAAALSRSTGGFVLGGDVSASRLLGGDWRFGLAGGYTNDSINVSSRLSSGTFASVFGGAYAGASFGAVRLRAGALYGTNTTSTTRTIIFPGFSDATAANHGGSTAQAFGEAGYRIQLSGVNFGGLSFSRASLEPFVGTAAIQIHQNGFTENGGPAALIGSAKNFDLETTTLGVNGELAFADLPLTLSTTLGWRHAFGDVVPSAILAFQGGAQGFSIAGIPIDRDAFVAEARVNYLVTSSITVGLSYAGQFGSRAYDNAFKGHVDLRF